MEFIGKHIPLSQKDIIAEGARHQVRVSLFHAFSDVESSGSGFLPSGEPKILFESHEFSILTGGKYDHIAPDLSTPNWVRNYGAGGLHQYDRLRRAMALDENAALSACSWGRFQQMGYQYKRFGFATVIDFVEFMMDSEANHLAVFGEYCDASGMLPYMKTNPPSYAELALLYNGKGYRQNGYDQKLAVADAHYGKAGENYVPAPIPIGIADQPQATIDPPSQPLRELKLGCSGDDVKALQRALGIHADGLFGQNETLPAVVAWEKRNGYTPNGVVDTKQRQALGV